MKLLSSNFDIDLYINRIVPRSRIHLLPKPISWFLGYREEPTKPVGSIIIWFWSFIGAFAGILIIEAVFRTPGLHSHGTPIVIGSLGAAAILEYQVIDSPLSQPRNAILGQLFSTIIGVGITKLFQHSQNFEDIRWIAGALAVGLSSVVMGVTKTVHPPAGATALLAATSPDITDLGWFLIPLVLIGSTLMVASACVVNNIQRQFPVYWWTAASLRKPSESDIEKVGPESGVSDVYEGENIGMNLILVDRGRVLVPEWLSLGYEEKALLDSLRDRLEAGDKRTQRSESTASGMSGQTAI
ncbi:hypothetical protein GLAREA_07762 [Glarea lozoyensis ATCC 20868]|uniref:HPP transmembrane region domain-containing protein n=1 Tax=Glarea lozoyensis (strain ATCC 20868 / MF5171) TaxID=1116229 RepID=S3E2D4_GLAL2|nr:uncharacterized protein GLAREA_07762 [Glarea lozoyensis ATCC 20868]EPE32628.1 hypothetical protein GLAREA_07762 [Glarea lozoyensis ATCC 20868]